MPQSTVSSHVQVIRKAGLLASERCEKWIYYRLKEEFRSLIAGLGKRFAATEMAHATMAKDAKRARKRLEERAESCCPGPVRLGRTLLQASSRDT
jgi:DNA-binding transcriptional ArsR family regulator